MDTTPEMRINIPAVVDAYLIKHGVGRIIVEGIGASPANDQVEVKPTRNNQTEKDYVCAVMTSVIKIKCDVNEAAKDELSIMGMSPTVYDETEAYELFKRLKKKHKDSLRTEIEHYDTHKSKKKK